MDGFVHVPHPCGETRPAHKEDPGRQDDHDHQERGAWRQKGRLHAGPVAIKRARRQIPARPVRADGRGRGGPGFFLGRWSFNGVGGIRLSRRKEARASSPQGAVNRPHGPRLAPPVESRSHGRRATLETQATRGMGNGGPAAGRGGTCVVGGPELDHARDAGAGFSPGADRHHHRGDEARWVPARLCHADPGQTVVNPARVSALPMAGGAVEHCDRHAGGRGRPLGEPDRVLLFPAGAANAPPRGGAAQERGRPGAAAGAGVAGLPVLFAHGSDGIGGLRVQRLVPGVRRASPLGRGPGVAGGCVGGREYFLYMGRSLH